MAKIPQQLIGSLSTYVIVGVLYIQGGAGSQPATV